jgi:CheY-like chemotaxis protein
MGADTLAHLYEPFYTTKERGKGTGLGLATVHGIVTQSGGHLRYTTSLGQGTEFRVYLPVDDATDEPPAPFAPVARPAGADRGGETLLVVEDDPDVRAIVVEMLADRGYRVLEARDGAHAVEIARTHPERIHLLVTDVVMPALGGREVAQLVRRARPDVRVLFLSGYADEAFEGRDPGPSEGVLLAKPFSSDLLAGTVREVLDAGGPAAPGGSESPPAAAPGPG